ncbi:MAG: DNA mismatch repair endonuclease MutL, partial [Muribaculaceae bacterium]|nr:DNA mismatch repair endonuclease MutL [Muribaculaceae bacterium]
DVIRLLPDSVANQIAAGEVIQRPASVIKELVENAVDAGATAITIVIKDAGRTLIQVIDNGSGMSPTDARMAFERHATSKISSADDLYSLHTMGFRGEALPSIAAVSQIDLRTMREGDTVGVRLLISESRFEGQEPVSCVPGTNISVKNIFFHMPARRKFLKKDSVELGHIMREFERLALVNTGIDFTLIHNDVTLHQFSHGTFKQRIGALFGKNSEGQIAEIGTETSLVKISGFIGMPRFAKKRGFNQFFFVNGRNMRHPAFHRALMNCYEPLVLPQAQPSYFINFEVDPSTIDVNIHPQKHEIKFEHEQAIMQILLAAVRETLGKTQAAGALDFEADIAPDIPIFDPSADAPMPDDSADDTFNPFRAATDNPEPAVHARQWQTRPAPTTDWEALYDNFTRKRDDAFASSPTEVYPDEEMAPTDLASSESSLFKDEGAIPSVEKPTACFQLHEGYIVTPSRSGIMVISQHRAHVRILYDNFMRQMDGGPVPSQQLIFSEDFELSPSSSALLEQARETLESVGFTVVHSGGNRWSLTSVPASLSGGKAVEALLGILEDVAADILVDSVAFRSPVALAMARSAAISASQTLTPAEMESIIADLFRCTESSFTPDGLVVMTLIESGEISARLQ